MMNILPQFDTIGGLIALILGFGFIIFVHELGHFLVAKWVGIRATQFAIGFGPSMLTWRKGIGFRVGTTEPEYERRALEYLKKQGASFEGLTDQQKIATIYGAADALGLGETEYRLNYIPLGGYVKMLGQEDIDPAARSEDPRSYTSRPVWARMAVISAGVVMNLIFAMVFFIIAFMAGVEFPPAAIGEIGPQSPAATTYAVGHEGNPDYRGLRFGDRVVSINGREPIDFTDIMLAAALSGEGEQIELIIEREGEAQPLTYRIEPKRVGNLYAIGVMPPASLELASSLARGDSWPTRLQAAGVEMGMVATAANGQPLDNYKQFETLLQQSNGEPINVTFTDPDTGKTANYAVTPEPLVFDKNGKIANPLGIEAVTRIAGVLDDSPAQAAKLQPDDLIAMIGNVRWPTGRQVQEVTRSAKDTPIRLQVMRGSELIDLNITPKDGRLGIELGQDNRGHRISSIDKDSPLAPLNLTAGSRILAVNGKPIDGLIDLLRHLGDMKEPGTISIEYELNIADQPVATEEIAISEATLAKIDRIEWYARLPFVTEKQLIQTDSPLVAAELGVKKTRQTMLSVYVTLARLVQGRVPASELRGPIGIADIGTQIARDQGIMYLIYFLGLISVNLAVVNFLPVPVVDGGHMVFLIAEKIKGSPVNPKIQIGATYVGLALILCVFVMTFYFDTTRLFSGDDDQTPPPPANTSTDR